MKPSLKPNYFLAVPLFLILSFISGIDARGFDGPGWCKHFPGGCDGWQVKTFVGWLIAVAVIIFVSFLTAFIWEKCTTVDNSRTGVIVIIVCFLVCPISLCCFGCYLFKHRNDDDDTSSTNDAEKQVLEGRCPESSNVPPTT